MKSIRNLTADEIEARVATINEKGLSLLLYKDARVDMNILDESFGIMNWQKCYEMIGDRLYCTVSVYDEEKKQWICKQDVGTESYTEKEKGQASDAFKRACFNLGIGRELYTAPFIWISKDKYNASTKNGKSTTYDKFDVDSVEIENHKIIGLKIRNCNTNKIVFTYGANKSQSQTKTVIAENGMEKTIQLIKPQQKQYLLSIYEKCPNKLEEVLKKNKVATIDEMPYRVADDLIVQIEMAKMQKGMN